jgi:DNA-binding PadR family transcriptional regulator
MARMKKQELGTHRLSPLKEDLLNVCFDRELYSTQIEKRLHEVYGRNRSFGSIYPTLRDLEKQGLLESRWADDRPENRSGARKRFYKTTGLGKTALQAAEERRRELRDPGWEPTFETG